ncbi:MAG: aldo/keto reductase [Planctomycetota bacterium]|nr:aldo/keto reductase [Planctomycetota bacterium]
MQYRQLGQSELKVSAIGMGCVTFGREIDRDNSFGVLDHALAQGINLFDTAEAYAKGASEAILGEWIDARKVRDKMVLATKVSGKLTKERVTSSCDESLKRLKTDRIDLFQLHNWDGNTPLDETLGALEALVQHGKIRYIGVSNWQTWQLAKSLIRAVKHAGIRFESIQPPYNLVQREIETDLLPLCLDQQIGVLSYSPLGAGFLTGKYSRGGDVPKGTRFDIIPGHQPIYFTEPGFRVLEGLQNISQETGRSLIDLSLAWVLGRPGITTMLVGARSPSHIDQALAAENNPLSDELRERLGKL